MFAVSIFHKDKGQVSFLRQQKSPDLSIGYPLLFLTLADGVAGLGGDGLPANFVFSSAIVEASIFWNSGLGCATDTQEFKLLCSQTTIMRAV